MKVESSFLSMLLDRTKARRREAEFVRSAEEAKQRCEILDEQITELEILVREAPYTRTYPCGIVATGPNIPYECPKSGDE